MAADEEIILDIKIDKGQSERQIDALTKSIESLKDENKELLESNKDLKKSGEANSKQYLDNAKQVEINKQAISKNNIARKSSIQAIKAEDNSMAALKASMKQNKAARDQLNTSTVEGRKEFERLTTTIKGQNDALKEAEEATGVFSRSVGDYKKGLGETITQQQVFGVSLGDIGSKMTALINPVTAAVGILTGLVSLYLKSAAGAADLASAQRQLSTSVTSVSNNLAKLVGADGKGGGLLSALAFQFNKALFGVKAAAQGIAASSFERLLQELEVVEFETNRIAKDQLRRAEELRQLRDEERNSLSARIKANEDLKTIIDEREQGQIDFQKKRLNAAERLLALDENNLDFQKQVKQIELEIADAREEAAGFRSEALINDLALFKEGQELRRKASEKESERLQKAHEQRGIDIELQIQQEFDKELQIAANRIAIEADVTKALEAEQESRVAVDKAAALKRKDIILSQAKLNRDVMLAQTEFELNLMSNLTGSLINLLGRESAAGKVAALFQLTVDSAAAIAKGILASQSVPFPGNLAAMATTIGAITANIASAKNIITSAKEPKFAKGGSIEIGGKRHSQGGTKFVGSDGTRFEAEQGEGLFVLKRNAYQDIGALSALNVKHGGVSFSHKKSFLQSGGQVSVAQNRASRSTDIQNLVRETVAAIGPIIVTIEDVNAGLVRLDQTITQAKVQ